MREAVVHKFPKEKAFVIDDMLSMKLGLPSGQQASPDELIEITVDGTEVPLRVVFQQGEPSGGSPSLKGLSWRDVVLDANLGGLYELIEDVWEDFLWNDYFVDGTDLRSACGANVDWKAVSSHRKKVLDMQFLVFASQYLSSLPEEEQRRFQRIRSLKKTERRGKRTFFVFDNGPGDRELATGLAVVKMYAQEEYYADLLDQEVDSRPGLTLRRVLDGWHVVALVAESAWARLVALDNQAASVVVRGQSDEENNFFIGFCPTFENDSLHSAIGRELELPPAIARDIVSFLTYRGQSGQELWTQPIVKISPTKVAPFFGALKNPNLPRVVDTWMKQLGLDLGARGPAFEKHVRQRLSGFIAESKILGPIGSVLPDSFVFRPTDGRKEEIDVVVVFANLVILVECKCILQPTEAEQFYRHRETIRGAVEQIERKARAVRECPDAFAAQLRGRGLDVPEAFSVLPLVLLNGAIHVGREMNGIAICDMTLFRIYCDGRVPGLSKQEEGGMKVLEEYVFYSNATEAIQNAPAYFARPNHLNYLWDSLRDCDYLVPSPPQSVLGAARYWSREVVVDSKPYIERANAMS